MTPLLLLTLAAPAAALEPTAELHLLGAVSTSGQDGRSGVATGGAAGVVLTGPLDLELSFDAGASAAETLLVAATPQLRLWLTPRQGRAGALSLTAGGGLWVAPKAGGTIAPGLAWDLPGKRTWVPRVQTRYLVDPRNGRGALTLSIGVAGPHREAAAEPEPEPIATLPERPPYRWYPHPVSACVANAEARPVADSSSAAGSGSETAPTSAATSAASSTAPRAPTAGSATADTVVDTVADTPSAAGALPAQPQPLDLAALLQPEGGGLVIVVDPGDEVAVAGHVLPVGSDHTVVLATDTGTQVVDVTGAGRVRTVKPSVAEGHATWVRVPSRHGAHFAHFEQGSSSLTEAEQARLDAIAARAGGWRFRLTGEYSAEGSSDANQRLAAERAAATRDALVAAGLPEDRIELAPPEPGNPDARVEDQRVCRIQPLPPAEEP